MIKKQWGLENDFALVKKQFPKLNFGYRKKMACWIVSGDLDICDLEGVYWGTFSIRIMFPHNYPYVIPSLYEVSKIIPRQIDNHIDENGLCCVDIDHKLAFRAKKGISMLEYILTWAYPYFANQLFKLVKKQYAGAEYAHCQEGVKQFYTEDLHLSTSQAIGILRALLDANPPGRNIFCPCGSEVKMKKCHLEAIEFLKSINKKQLKMDLGYFLKCSG